ncbi:MAG: phosphoenolpyruvate carboxykinase (ATP) [Phycisphaerales bacterium]|nr:phosphoenolpyruvate carboxykinase (ATP) [Phycisphaerales bacterium]
MSAVTDQLNLSPDRTHTNCSSAELMETVIRRGEGQLAANGCVSVNTGDRTGRSPTDKYLVDSPAVHENIDWGKVNQPMTQPQFDTALDIATKFINSQDEVFVFEGFTGADTSRRLGVKVITTMAWHSLFAQTLFIKPGSASDAGDGSWNHDWTVINAGVHKLTKEEQESLGVTSETFIAQSLEQKIVVILGTEYAGEMKKSLFYAMNYDMPDVGVFPMHCSANIAKDDPSNVALFFGLSGTGKTTLSADENRALIGDDEHGWGPEGVFNFEGGCYAKVIGLTHEKEPQIWDAIRFGSVLENTVIDDATRIPDYDNVSITQNTRVTYPVDFIPGAQIPSVGGHPKNVIFLTADAFGVLPAISKLTPEQAMYYFINGYTSKLAGTEEGVTEPQPNFSPCFGGPFMPRRPAEYAQMLSERIKEHSAHVWLLNTGWCGGPAGAGGNRFSLPYTRAMVTGILNGSLDNAPTVEHPVFGLHMPTAVEGVPSDILDPRNIWEDKAAYDAQCDKLAKLFRANDAKFDLSDAIRSGGPNN